MAQHPSPSAGSPVEPTAGPRGPAAATPDAEDSMLTTRPALATLPPVTLAVLAMNCHQASPDPSLPPPPPPPPPPPRRAGEDRPAALSGPAPPAAGGGAGGGPPRAVAVPAPAAARPPAPPPPSACPPRPRAAPDPARHVARQRARAR